MYMREKKEQEQCNRWDGLPLRYCCTLCAATSRGDWPFALNRFNGAPLLHNILTIWSSNAKAYWSQHYVCIYSIALRKECKYVYLLWGGYAMQQNGVEYPHWRPGSIHLRLCVPPATMLQSSLHQLTKRSRVNQGVVWWQNGGLLVWRFLLTCTSNMERSLSTIVGYINDIRLGIQHDLHIDGNQWWRGLEDL